MIKRDLSIQILSDIRAGPVFEELVPEVDMEVYGKKILGIIPWTVSTVGAWRSTKYMKFEGDGGCAVTARQAFGGRTAERRHDRMRIICSKIKLGSGTMIRFLISFVSIMASIRH